MNKTFGALFSDSIKEYGNKFVPILKTFLILYLVPMMVLVILFMTIFISILPISDFNFTNLTDSITGLSIFENAGTALWGSSLFIIFIVLMNM